MQRGFSFLEMLVVFVFFSVLVGLSLATFKSYKDKANDVAAEVTLNNLINASQAAMLDENSIAGATKITFNAVCGGPDHTYEDTIVNNPCTDPLSVYHSNNSFGTVTSGSAPDYNDFFVGMENYERMYWHAEIIINYEATDTSPCNSAANILVQHITSSNYYSASYNGLLDGWVKSSGVQFDRCSNLNY